MNKEDKIEADKQIESLLDLPVTDEQADQTKAAGAPNGRLFLGTQVGVF
jgi:hypothetical protein